MRLRSRVRGRATCALLVGVAIAAASCASGGGPGRAPSAVSCSPATPPLLPCSAAALPTYDLATFQRLLDQLHGKPVLVNIWASWCGPCIAEAPALTRLERAFGGKVQFVGVDILDAAGPARAFIEKYHWRYPSIADPTGAIRNGLGYVGQPVTIVYDSNGTKVFELSGPITEATLRRELSKVAG